MKGGPLSAWTSQMLLFTFFSHVPLHMLRDCCHAIYLVVSAIPLAWITQCYWRVLACINVPDLTKICKCDCDSVATTHVGDSKFILTKWCFSLMNTFNFDGSTMRTHRISLSIWAMPLLTANLVWQILMKK